MSDRAPDGVEAGGEEGLSVTTNPYVGPRPFEATDRDRFFGRTSEIRQLASLVIARRVVVLYARSGTGKTSLLKAGLVPYLEMHKGLETLPILRLGSELGDLLSSDGLATSSLADGIARQLISRPDDDTAVPKLLIVDQLEELFRMGSVAPQQKVDFFVQLRHCLDRHAQLSLLLSLREDAVAELDPHAGLFPDRLRSRFRLQPLGQEAALEAMQQPARRSGVELDDALARQLVDELRTVRIQRSDGAAEDILGPYIEPVHLQVVCHRLWREWVTERGADDGRHIGPSVLPTVGSIDSALTGYFAEQVAAVATATGAGERRIRDWLEGHLITEDGLRGQVLRGVGDSEDLPNGIIEALVDARLVRAETRRGATWFELAHDRLVVPLRASNTAWRQENLHPMQNRAELWASEGQPRSLLLSSRELRRELAWVKTQDDALTPAEGEFLAASRRARRTRRLRWLVLLVSLLLGAALWRLKEEQEVRQHELARGLAAQSRSRLDERQDLALLLSLEANRIDSSSSEIRGSLLTALQYQPRRSSSLHGHRATVWSVAFNSHSGASGGAHLASGDLDGQIFLWDIHRRPATGRLLAGHQDGILSLAYSPDGRFLLSTGRDRQALLWNLDQNPPSSRSLGLDLLVTSATFDPLDAQRLITGDTERLITGETEHRVSIWDLSSAPPRRRHLGLHDGWVTSVVVDPSGSGLVASGGADHRIRVWRHGEGLAAELSGHGDWISGLAWAPGGKILASASLDRTVRRWNMETFEEITKPPLETASDRLSAVTVSLDGTLAAATANGLIYLWEVDSGRSLGPPLAGNLALMHGMAFSPDGKFLAAGSGSTVPLWDVRDPESVVSPLGNRLGGGHGAVASLAFHPDNDLVAVTGVDDDNDVDDVDDGGDEDGGKIQILDRRGRALASQPSLGLAGLADAIAWSADGNTLAEFADNGRIKKIRLWHWPDDVNTWHLEEPIPSGIGADPDRRNLQSNLGDFARILEQTLEPRRIEGCPPVRALAFVEDRLLAAEGAPEQTRVHGVNHWNVRVGATAGLPQRQEGATGDATCVRSLAISPKGETLAAGSDSGLVTLFSLADFKSLGEPLNGHILPVRSLAFSPDSQLLASAGDEGTIHLRKLDGNPDRPKELTGHTGAVLALTFNRQGTILASAGRDLSVILWDVETGIAIGRPFVGHRGPIRSLAFNSYGDSLVSGGEDSAWLWQLGFETWRLRARRIANRQLTEEEREIYLSRTQR